MNSRLSNRLCSYGRKSAPRDVHSKAPWNVMINQMSKSIVCSCSLLSGNCHDSRVWTFANERRWEYLLIFLINYRRGAFLKAFTLNVSLRRILNSTSNIEKHWASFFSSSSFLLPLSFSARKCIFTSWPFTTSPSPPFSASLGDAWSAAQRVVDIRVFIFNSFRYIGDFVVILSSSSREFGCSRFNKIKEINSFIVVGEFLLLLTGPNSRWIHFQFDVSKVLLFNQFRISPKKSLVIARESRCFWKQTAEAFPTTAALQFRRNCSPLLVPFPTHQSQSRIEREKITIRRSNRRRRQIM